MKKIVEVKVKVDYPLIHTKTLYLLNIKYVDFFLREGINLISTELSAKEIQ